MTTYSSNSPASFSLSAAPPVGFENMPNSRLVFDRDKIRTAIDVLAVKVNVELHGKNPVFLSVLHGGLPFTGDLLLRFQGRCDLGYVHVGRYGAETSGGDLSWHVEPSVDLRDRTVIFVDDVLDRGETLAALRVRATELGAKDVQAAVLVRKTCDDCASRAEFVALEAPDLFLFGYGMDIDGEWRNLPEIRAFLPDEPEGPKEHEEPEGAENSKGSL